jgi:hypothetical protein
MRGGTRLVDAAKQQRLDDGIIAPPATASLQRRRMPLLLRPPLAPRRANGLALIWSDKQRTPRSVYAQVASRPESLWTTRNDEGDDEDGDRRRARTTLTTTTTKTKTTPQQRSSSPSPPPPTLPSARPRAGTGKRLAFHQHQEIERMSVIGIKSKTHLFPPTSLSSFRTKQVLNSSLRAAASVRLLRLRRRPLLLLLLRLLLLLPATTSSRSSPTLPRS